MVTLSSLEKISAVGKLSDCLVMSQSSVARDQKIDVVGEDGNNSISVHRGLSRSVNQNKPIRAEMYLDSPYTNGDRNLVGVVGAQNESSLFSSSLSDLFNQKLRMSSNKFQSRQSSVVPQIDEVEPFNTHEETEGQITNNFLPDEEELFSGIADEMGQMNNANAVDDLDDFDVFTYSGGIELDAEEHLQAGRRNVGYHWGVHQNQPRPLHVMDHGSRIHSNTRLSNGAVMSDASLHENSRVFNGFPSPVRVASVGNEYVHTEGSQSFPQIQLDNRGIPNFRSHSPQVPIHSVNVIPNNSLDGVTGFADEFRPRVSENLNLEAHHLGLNGHAREANDGVFGYSPNGLHVHQSMASKSNSYQQNHLRSLLMPNSPSLLNNNHGRHLGMLPGSPGAPHLMMNMVSPVHHLQVGSAPVAPVVKAQLWDRQQIYGGEPHEASGYQIGAMRNVGIPGFSASPAREISSPISFTHVHNAEMSKNAGIQSPQQMNHLFHERNSMNSLPTSFGSPSERVRRSRNETNLTHADRKHYELNIDRILRGDDNRTTLMIKNIPNKYTSKMLLATIDEQHRGKYDFIYLPIDFKNKCNMGYAFINMIDPLQIVAFRQTFEGRKWEKFNSEKVASLAYARIQGKAALIAHFQNSSLMNEDKRCRPILFHTDGPNAGDQEPFPMGTSIRAKPGRQQATSSEEEE
ncbi:protein MEI2-like 4 isoform X1 [Amaranthus tricolor]|uniref:protein MEI2-like 4 isoform X1 n=1 Tax=Amaranthus tricolor TaxID=29722 RepID=UPI00258D4C6F|nr:protein MEI2-like 4 isoform X1 [Amaranthus tricolor]XP_057519010.1 protein MEI2-like 4 isoform X1 [Amaranthus tricolor]